MSDLTSSLAQVNRPPEKFQPPRALNFRKEALTHKERTVDLFVESGATRNTGSIMTFHRIPHFVMCVWWQNSKRNS